MRNSECGMRNRSGMSRDTIPTLTFRIPHSAFRILVLLAACTPITTRPDFRPDPRALTVVLDARPERVTTVLDSLVAAESLEVARANVRDGYVETAWYDTQAHRTRHAPHPLLHDVEVEHRVAARSVREAHGEPEHRQPASHVAEPGHHVPLARYRDDRAGAALADHPPRELSSGCYEYRDVVAPGDRQHPIERLLGETARDENQQLALAHRPAAALGEGVVHVDGRVLHPIPLAERPRDKRGEAHQAEIGPPLEPALGEREHAPIEGKERSEERPCRERG